MTKEEKEERIARQRQKFYEGLQPYMEQYGCDMVRDFFEYWTELNPSRTRMRYEMQPTWETAKRLAFWSRNSKRYGTRKAASTTSSRENRLREYADIAAGFRQRSEHAQ